LKQHKWILQRILDGLGIFVYQCDYCGLRISTDGEEPENDELIVWLSAKYGSHVDDCDVVLTHKVLQT
jgi:hypothetical protein